MFFNRITAVMLCIAISPISFCQAKEPKIKFGDVKPADFAPKYYSLDSSAAAVYLYEKGSSTHKATYGQNYSVVYKRYERIRLLNKKSFDDLATVKVALSRSNNDEKLDDLQAATYNLEDGKVVVTKLDKSSVFKDKDGDNQVLKFTFPNIKEGCIIEYSYTLTIPAFYYIPAWSFQGDYPKLWTEFSVEIPELFDFVVLTQGYLDAEIDTVSSYTGYNGDVNTHTWAYKNMPALKKENYITSLSNYRQRVEFQLSAIRPKLAPTQYILNSWSKTVDELMKNENFGADLNKGNGWLKDDVKAATQNETDDLAKAKAIYDFVRDNYTCTDDAAMFLSQPLKKTQQLKKGNVADINMLLIAMMRLAGFSANPVLLSTRKYGKTIDVYPILTKFNYLIAQVDIDDNTTSLLDASIPWLGFAHLSQDCYNGNARLIAQDPVLLNLSPDSLHEPEVISLFMSNDDDGKISGSYKNLMNDMQSQELRSKMKKTTEEDYFKNIKKSFSFDVDINNANIDSLKQLEMPIAVQYDMSFKPDGDIVYFTPVLGDGAYKENPFSAAERYYPVEMPYCTDETYILSMEVPNGYKVDELPKSARVNLNNNEGMFEYLIQQNDNTIQLQCRTKINKATFEPDDYETLRSFFAMVVEKEGEQIVFKKVTK